MRKMKNLIKIILAIFCMQKITAQQPLAKNSSLDSPKLLLYNCLIPRAVITDNKDIIFVATGWTPQAPLIAGCIDSSGNLLWNNISLCSFPNDLDLNGNVFILPSSDGGAYFIFEYLEYKGYNDSTEYIEYSASHPHIQYIDAAGNVKWGAVGKRLSNIEVNFQGGADIMQACYAPDGNIIVYWDWFNDHHTDGVKNEYGTFVQKINPSNGELKFGERGRQLFNLSASPIKQGLNGNIYVLNIGDSVACFNAWAEKQWQLPLLTGIKNSCLTGTNEFGELLILYGTNNDIRASLYDENGSPILIR